MKTQLHSMHKAVRFHTTMLKIEVMVVYRAESANLCLQSEFLKKLIKGRNTLEFKVGIFDNQAALK